MARNKDLPYYIGLGLVVLGFGYFAVTNLRERVENDNTVTSIRTTNREPVADKFLKKFNQVPDFSLINQDGDTITNQDLLGKVYVVEFFFSNCPTICTPMNMNMEKVQSALKQYDDFAILSISIDPERDTPEAMKEYAQRFDADFDTWHFATGEQDVVYELARKGFNAYVGEAESEEIGFEHSGNFALVDREGYIRSRAVKQNGFDNFIYVYNGVTEEGTPAMVTEIVQDAKTLLDI